MKPTKTQKKDTPKKKRGFWVYMLPVWIAIVVIFVGYVSTQTARYQHYRTELSRLQAELQAERQIGENLEYQQSFFGGDAYIEQLARDRLGFVHMDEIIFVNIADTP